MVKSELYRRHLSLPVFGDVTFKKPPVDITISSPEHDSFDGSEEHIMNNLVTIVCMLLTLSSGAEKQSEYNPLSVTSIDKVKSVDLDITDKKRNREIPIRVWLPETKNPCPVLIFSHGLGGSRQCSPYLGKHWAGRNYVAVFVQHKGSDQSVWKDLPVLKRLGALKKAASAENFMLRVKDIPAVLDQLEIWNKEKGHELCGRLNLEKTGMTGHSFGAITTQAVSGQCIGKDKQTFTDARIDAALAMSPSSPRLGNPRNAFGNVTIPWLLMTGTKDISRIGNIDLKSRLAVFPALPAGDKYQLVLNNAQHSAFSDRSLPLERHSRNPNHHKVILAISTAFWDCYLKDDQQARKWLNGKGPESILEKDDKWEKK